MRSAFPSDPLVRSAISPKFLVELLIRFEFFQFLFKIWMWNGFSEQTHSPF